MPEMPEKLYTVQEAAQIFRVSEHTVYIWCREGKIESRKPGKKWLIPESAIQSFLNPEKTDG